MSDSVDLVLLDYHLPGMNVQLISVPSHPHGVGAQDVL
jgi:hypothetical protein